MHNRFVQATGNTEYDIFRYWPRFGDALKEAGLEPNKLNSAYDEALLSEKLVGLTRTLGKVPTTAELRVERARDDPTLPSATTYELFGSTSELLGRVLDCCRKRPEDQDVAAIIEMARDEAPRPRDDSRPAS